MNIFEKTTLNYMRLSKTLLKVVLFWVLFWLIQSILMSGGAHISFYLVKNIAIVGLQILIVHLNIHLWIPLFLKKGRIVFFLVVNFVLIYLAFSSSFFLIDNLLVLFFNNYLPVDSPWLFSLDFWIVLSGSSLYSLAFLASTIYTLYRQSQLKEHKGSVKPVSGIILKDGAKSHVVAIEDVLFVKRLKEYVVWQLREKTVVVLGTLRDIEETYAAHGFVRIHKSYIVNSSKIEIIQSSLILIQGYELPIGRKYKEETRKLIRNLHLIN